MEDIWKEEIQYVLLLEPVLNFLGKWDVYLWELATPPRKLTPICRANIFISGNHSRYLFVSKPASACCRGACLPRRAARSPAFFRLDIAPSDWGCEHICHYV